MIGHTLAVLNVLAHVGFVKDSLSTPLINTLIMGFFLGGLIATAKMCVCFDSLRLNATHRTLTHIRSFVFQVVHTRPRARRGHWGEHLLQFVDFLPGLRHWKYPLQLAVGRVQGWRTLRRLSADSPRALSSLAEAGTGTHGQERRSVGREHVGVYVGCLLVLEGWLKKFTTLARRAAMDTTTTTTARQFHGASQQSLSLSSSYNFSFKDANGEFYGLSTDRARRCILLKEFRTLFAEHLVSTRYYGPSGVSIHANNTCGSSRCGHLGHVDT